MGSFVDSIEIAKTTNPSPPIQLVKSLKSRRLLGSFSISVNMEAPVVVKPETASKYASIGLRIYSLIIYVKDASKGNKNQIETAIKTASFSDSFSCLIGTDKENNNKDKKRGSI